MAKSVGADGLRQTGTTNGHLDGFVDDAGVNVMATGDAGTRAYMGSLGVNGVVMQTEHLSHFIEEFGVLITGRSRHTMPPWWCPENGDNRQKCSKTGAISDYQGKMPS
jgi:hypothetical protein